MKNWNVSKDCCRGWLITELFCEVLFTTKIFFSGKHWRTSSDHFIENVKKFTNVKDRLFICHNLTRVNYKEVSSWEDWRKRARWRASDIKGSVRASEPHVRFWPSSCRVTLTKTSTSPFLTNCTFLRLIKEFYPSIIIVFFISPVSPRIS